MSADAYGCAYWRAEAAGDKVLARELGSGMAGWRGDVRVYVLARGASSGAGFDAGEAVGICDSIEGVGTDLAVGSVVEGSGDEDSASIIGRSASLSLDGRMRPSPRGH